MIIRPYFTLTQKKENNTDIYCEQSIFYIELGNYFRS